MKGRAALDTVNLGLDFGCTGLRAAYARPGERVRFAALTGPQWPGLLCEPGGSGGLEVRFPSVKSRLGIIASVAVGGSPADPAVLVSRALESMRERAEAEASARVGKTVISVPARYTSAQRTALRDAAYAAGLSEVQFINDSAAAVIQWGRRPGSGGAVLVYGMGYTGFELGLIRAEGGRYQVLGYESAGAPGGSTFDRQVLAWWLATLREHRVLPDISRWDTTTWLRHRAAAQLVKEELGSLPTVPFGIPVPRPGGDELTVRFEREQVAAAQRMEAEKTLGPLGELLKRCHLTATDLDAVLLVGGSTRMPSVRDLVEESLGREASRTSSEHLARAALLQADRLGGVAPSGDEDYLDETSDEAQEPGRDASVSAAVVTTRDAPSGGALELPAGTPAAENPAPQALGEAHRLIGEGRPSEAALLLREVIAEAQSLLEKITEGGAPTAAQRLMTSARTLLEQKRYERAVRTSHEAWAKAPSDPDIFEAMIDIHSQAAMAEITVEQYPDAERWLRCAYSHDQSNVRVRELLAERTYEHARQLNGLGRRRDASPFLDQCLSWNPEHDGAKKLQERIARRPPITPR